MIVDPVKLSSYGLQLDQLMQGDRRSPTAWLPRATIEGSEGKYAVKVPSLIETPEDVANLPVVARSERSGAASKDVASIRSTFKDAETITRLDGKPAIAIEVKKRIGANIVETIEGSPRAVANEFVKIACRLAWKSPITQDKSVFVKQLLNDLHQPCADRGHPGLHRHPLRTFRSRLVAHRPGDSRHPS